MPLQPVSSFAAGCPTNYADVPICIMPPSGGVYWVGTQTNSNGTSAPAVNEFRLSPVFITSTVLLDRIAGKVTTGAASSTVRLGIYADSGAGVPGSLILDAGTIDGNSVSTQAITISQVLAPGLYWIGGVSQGGTPTVQVTSGNSMLGMPHSFGATYDPTISVNGYNMTGVSGALPATYTVAAVIGTVPRIGLRVA